MPDWVSHILLALILCEIFGIKRKSLIVLGSLMPDLIVKIASIGMFVNIPANSEWFLMPFHSLAGCFLFSLFTLPLFGVNLRTLGLIAVGWMSHFLLDLMYKTYEYVLFFPFTWKSFCFGLIELEEYWIILLCLLGIYLTILLIKIAKKV